MALTKASKGHGDPLVCSGYHNKAHRWGRLNNRNLFSEFCQLKVWRSRCLGPNGKREAAGDADEQFQPNGSAVKLLSRRFLADVVTPLYNLQSASTGNYPVLRINSFPFVAFFLIDLNFFISPEQLLTGYFSIHQRWTLHILHLPADLPCLILVREKTSG